MKQPILLALLFALTGLGLSATPPRPNIILAMADDMGWGDPGYNSITVTYADGTPHPDQGWINTPTMDTMAASGLRFDRFYSASSVCSPTRASCLTGRSPIRVGVPYANLGRLGFDETPLSEVLSDAGYRCGHFGKWHLGTLTTLRDDSNRGPDASVYSAPWHHRYDFCFVTESKVPTYHPYRKTTNGLPLPTGFTDPNFYGTHYWKMPTIWNQTSGEGQVVPVNEVNNATDGDDSKLMVDQAIPFMQDAVSQGKPFFLVLWFHTPHKPIVDPEGTSGVNSSDAAKDAIEDLDTALGRVRDELDTLGVRGNTMFWVTSDNGPENGVDSPNETSTVRPISSGRFLERKRSLHEGGVRVPGILEWPDVITSGMATDFPAITTDYYPTILDYLQLSVPNQKPLDGISLRPVIDGTATTRTKPVGFKVAGGGKSWVNHQYKLIDDGESNGWELYDLINIASGEEVEQTPTATAANIGSKPQAIRDVYNTMLAEYTAWNATVGPDTPYVHPSQPTVVLGTPSDTVSEPFAVTATFSKAVTQLNANEFVVGNGTASGLAGGGTTWTITVTPAANGAVTVDLPEGCAIDPDGNINAAANRLSVTYADPSGPGVNLSTPADPVSTGFIVTATFTEDVTGLVAADFDVTNGAAAGLGGGPAIYTVTVTSSVPGDVTITLPAGSVTALDDGSANTVSNSLVTSYAPDPPSLLNLPNGDLNTPVPRVPGTAAGTTPWSFDPATNSVLYGGSDSGAEANEWIEPTLSKGFTHDPDGGAGGTGDGAFVGSPADNFNGKPRAVFYFVDDNKNSTGPLDFGIDVFLDDNSAANPLLFLVELYAWNDGQTAPLLSAGGGAANNPSYHETTLNDAVEVLKTMVPATGVADAAWESVSLGTTDVGAGYDNYVWRIGVLGATPGDLFAFDNLIISTPPALAITDFHPGPGAEDVTIEWNSVPAASYQVQVNDDLRDDWDPVEDVAGSSGATTSYTHMGGMTGFARRFYRIALLSN